MYEHECSEKGHNIRGRFRSLPQRDEAQMARPCKVLWLIKGLGVGGAERLLAASVPYLDRSRFDYEIAYFLPQKTAFVEHFTSHGIPVFCIDSRNLLDPRIISRLTRLLKEREVRILDIHLPYPGVIGRIAGRQAGVQTIVYTEHSLSVQRRLTGFRFVSFLANILTYGLNDLIVTVSRDTYNDVRRFNFWRTPVQLVYNGIDLESLTARPRDRVAARRALRIPENHKIVGHVANLAPKKKQDDLLRAASIVLAHYPEVTFVMVGRGPLLDRLQHFARTLGIERNVRFLGFVEDVYQVVDTFDIFALSSLHEGLPTVAIEAMALGKPVVATRVGGTPEVVTDGVDGFLTAPRNPDELAERLVKLLRDDQLRHAMGERAIAKAHERFDIRRRVREMEGIYEGLVSGRETAMVVK